MMFESLIASRGITIERGSPAESSLPYVREAWAAGLDALGPSVADLEHGLALHRDALAIDTFAFLPVIWSDPMIAAREELIAQGVAGGDFQFRDEQLRLLGGTLSVEAEKQFLEALWCTGLNGTFHSAGEGKTREQDFKRIAASGHVSSHFGPGLRVGRSPADFEESFTVGFSVNGPPMTGHLYDPAEEMHWMEAWVHFGIRMMHLSYNRRNVIATGCAERHDGGLSELGYELIERMNRLGVIVDVPHSSEASSLQAASATARPMIASHVCCRALFDHMRNKSDAVLKAIAGTDGLVGITSRPSFMGPGASITTLLDHVDHAVRTVGPRHVAIGTDTTYISAPGTPPARPHPSAFSPRWWGAWHRQQTHTSTGSNDHRTGTLAWTNWPLITVGLVQRGYSDDDIRQILGLNLLRVLKANNPCL